MSRFKKLVALMAVAATIGSSAGVFAANYNNGYAYEGTRRASSISPWLAVGAVAVVTTAAIVIYNNNHHHHSSSSSDNGGGGGATHGHGHAH